MKMDYKTFYCPYYADLYGELCDPAKFQTQFDSGSYLYTSYAERVESPYGKIGVEMYRLGDLGSKSFLADVYCYSYARSAHLPLDQVSLLGWQSVGGWNVAYADGSVSFIKMDWNLANPAVNFGTLPKFWQYWDTKH
jgi:prepilin-type processing-associated H-X9-DG protein